MSDQTKKWWTKYAWQARRLQMGFSAKEFRRQTIDLLFPPRCPITDEPVSRQGTFAPEVWQNVRQMAPPWCEKCGMPFAYEVQAASQCVVCASPDDYPENLTAPGRLDLIRSALIYDEASAPAILRLKYADRFDGVAAFSHIMAGAGRDILTLPHTVLLPVPLHHQRLRARRYNQAGLLAEGVSKVTGVPVDHQLLKRVRPTPSQKGGDRKQRMKNVKGAFEVQKGQDLSAQNFVLVDDVLTTGATLLACAAALRQAGAHHVHAILLSRVVKSVENPLS
ncbi:MAG: double zinc ribbon domain-containing protein [Pseudomonadota bacterium]